MSNDKNLQDESSDVAPPKRFSKVMAFILRPFFIWGIIIVLVILYFIFR